MREASNWHSREEALAAVEDERQRWLTLVERVGPGRMEAPGAAGDWTFKDVAAHLSFWMEDIILTLEAAANQEPVDLPRRWPAELSDPEAINQWAWRQNRDRSVEDVLSEHHAGYDRMRRAIEVMPEETLNATDVFDWQNGEPFSQWLVDRRLFNHFYREHQPDIEAWLAGE
jgi:hypothetical protein